MIATTSLWPKTPYRGLDYYTEVEAKLFRERDDDVRECGQLLLGWMVKFLIIHGPSGSGKSSFLRAGLIPYLKKGTEIGEGNFGKAFFLSGFDSVIRCTSDPLEEIATYIDAAMKNEAALANEPTDLKDRQGICIHLPGKDVRKFVLAKLASRAGRSQEERAEDLVDALSELAGDLPGKLILALDQAEEVLAPSAIQQVNSSKLRSFFLFLERVYIRNIDVRLVISLRTEFYGRFRAELRMPDDRLSNRPRSGGIETYLLRSLRDRKALIRTIEAPLAARANDGKSVYDFKFQDNLVEEIVDDLLSAFPQASVTPALQVVCACLYDRLSASSSAKERQHKKRREREITASHFRELGAVNGIIQSYLDQGIRSVAGSSASNVNKWYDLLYSLVCRQGGGTVVSATESVQALVAKAEELGIRGRVDNGLVNLCNGSSPLLRGDPPRNPLRFSLKHDILAVRLYQWRAERDGEEEAASKARKKYRQFAAAIAASIGALCIAFAITLDRNQAAVNSQSRALEIKNDYAENEPTSDFKLALLIQVSNLNATKPRDLSFFSHLNELLTNGRKKNHEKTLSALRRTLPRVPRFYGRYVAAGINSPGRLAAFLTEDLSMVEILRLPLGHSIEPDLKPERRSLPPPVPSVGQTRFLRTVGFVDELGLVAVIGDSLYFWDEKSQMHIRSLKDVVPETMIQSTFLRADFSAGKLLLIGRTIGENTTAIRIASLEAAQIRSEPIPKLKASRPLVEHAGLDPTPALSNLPDQPLLYASYERVKETPSSQPLPVLTASNVNDDTLSVGGVNGSQIVIGSVMLERPPLRLASTLTRPPSNGRATSSISLAFAENSRSVIVKGAGPRFEIIELSANLSDNTLSSGDLARKEFGVEDPVPNDNSSKRSSEWQIWPASIPFQYPPLAAAHVDRNWRAAWLASNGVWVVESVGNTGTSRPLHDAPLMSGTPGGLRLGFAGDGDYLILYQQKQFGDPIQVSVWDLRPDWIKWISDASGEELRSMACKIVLMDGEGGTFTNIQANLLDITPSLRDPCYDIRSSSHE